METRTRPTTGTISKTPSIPRLRWPASEREGHLTQRKKVNARNFDQLPARRTDRPPARCFAVDRARSDRKSTRLNSSHQIISYAVFCLKKKKTSCSATTQ